MSRTAHEVTRRWIQDVVIGLNLCPFAKPVMDNALIDVFEGEDLAELTDALDTFIQEFATQDDEQVPTAILVTPDALREFGDYNDYLEIADNLIRTRELEGIVQIASFHPHYRFAGSADDDPSNYSNRSPYPMFHLLREDHVAEAVERFPDTLKIPEGNVRLLRAMGLDAVRALRDQSATVTAKGGHATS